MDKFYRNLKTDDEYYTPEYAVEIIKPYVKPKSKIWCPFDKNESNYVSVFRRGGYEVVNSHIEYGQDFFDMEVPTDIDYIISNPPYSKKDEVYKRLFEIGKPFAMLINVQGFCDSKIRSYLFAKYGVQIMYIYPRVNYIKDGVQTKGNAFQSGYICYQMLPKDLMIYINKGKQQSFDFIE